jgi:hypothetical protein
MNLTYQRAVQVLNDRFSNVEHALQVNQAELNLQTISG